MTKQQLLAEAGRVLVERATRIVELSKPLGRDMHATALLRLEYWKEAANALADDTFLPDATLTGAVEAPKT